MRPPIGQRISQCTNQLSEQTVYQSNNQLRLLCGASSKAVLRMSRVTQDLLSALHLSPVCKRDNIETD